MFEAIVEKICEQVREKINPSQTSWSYYDLTGKAADDIVKKIFTARYESIFQAEKGRILESPASMFLNYDKATKPLDQLLDELKRNLIFSKDEFQDIIKNTLSERLRYLAEPLLTMESILFSDGDSCEVGEVIARFREFEKFRYYPDALEKFTKAKGITHFNKFQFRLLINEINQSLFGQAVLENILKLCGLIIKEINDFRGKAGNTIEIDILIRAFKDRALRDFETAIKIEKELGNSEINLYGLRQVLQRFIMLKEKKSGDRTTATKVIPAEAPIQTIQEEPSVPKEDTGELIDIKEIFSKQPVREKTDELRPITQERTSETITISSINKTMTIKFAPDKAEEVTGQFAKQDLNKGFSDDTQAIRIKDIKESDNLVLLQTVITPKDEQIFIKAIFGDIEKYQQFINQINRVRSWKEAILVVDDILHDQKIDPFSKEAVRLSDLIYARYYPPEN